MSRLLFVLLTCMLLGPAAHAADGSWGNGEPYRLADGSVVAVDAPFKPAALPNPRAMIPKYPIELIRRGVQGRFLAELVVSATGDVVLIEVKQPVARALQGVITRHLRRLKFTPASMAGEPVASRNPVQLDFVADAERPPTR